MQTNGPATWPFSRKKLLILNGLHQYHKKEPQTKAYQEYRSMYKYCVLIESKLTGQPLNYQLVGKSFMDGQVLSHSKDDAINLINSIEHEETDILLIFIGCHGQKKLRQGRYVYTMRFEKSGEGQDAFELASFLGRVGNLRRTLHVSIVIISCNCQYTEELFLAQPVQIQGRTEIFYSVWQDDKLFLEPISKKFPNGCLPLLAQALSLDLNEKEKKYHQQLIDSGKVILPFVSTRKRSQWKYMMNIKEPEKFLEEIQKSLENKELLKKKIDEQVDILQRIGKIVVFSPLNSQYQHTGIGKLWNDQIMFVGEINGQGKLHIKTQTTTKDSWMQIYSTFQNSRATGLTLIEFSPLQSRSTYYIRSMLAHYDVGIDFKFKSTNHEELRFNSYQLVKINKTVLEISKRINQMDDKLFVKIFKDKEGKFTYFAYIRDHNSKVRDIELVKPNKLKKYQQQKKCTLEYTMTFTFSNHYEQETGHQIVNFKVKEDPRKSSSAFEAVSKKYPVAIASMFDPFCIEEEKPGFILKKFELKVHFGKYKRSGQDRQIIFIESNLSHLWQVESIYFDFNWVYLSDWFLGEPQTSNSFYESETF